MAHEFNCPHCGSPLLATPHTVGVPHADPVELLHREIEHLRVTIARLRGAGSTAAGLTTEGSGRAG